MLLQPREDERRLLRERKSDLLPGTAYKFDSFFKVKCLFRKTFGSKERNLALLFKGFNVKIFSCHRQSVGSNIDLKGTNIRVLIDHTYTGNYANQLA